MLSYKRATTIRDSRPSGCLPVEPLSLEKPRRKYVGHNALTKRWVRKSDLLTG